MKLKCNIKGLVELVAVVRDVKMLQEVKVSSSDPGNPVGVG